MLTSGGGGGCGGGEDTPKVSKGHRGYHQCDHQDSPECQVVFSLHKFILWFWIMFIDVDQPARLQHQGRTNQKKVVVDDHDDSTASQLWLLDVPRHCIFHTESCVCVHVCGN